MALRRSARLAAKKSPSVEFSPLGHFPPLRRSTRLAAKPKMFYYEVTETGRPILPYNRENYYWEGDEDRKLLIRFWTLYNSQQMRATYEPHWTKTRLGLTPVEVQTQTQTPELQSNIIDGIEYIRDATGPRRSCRIAKKAMITGDLTEYYTFSDCLVVHSYQSGSSRYIQTVPIRNASGHSFSYRDLHRVISHNSIDIIRDIARHCGVINPGRKSRKHLIHTIAHFKA